VLVFRLREIALRPVLFRFSDAFISFCDTVVSPVITTIAARTKTNDTGEKTIMALINPGIAGELAGSIGGTTYARNKAGAYARAWAKPVNPNTTAQSVARGNFAYGSGMWATLTLAQKEAWNAYALSITRVNRFGQPYTPSGRQIYMELATNAMTLAQPPLTLPPVETAVPGLSGTGATITTAAGPPIHIATLNLTGLSVSNSANPTIFVYATPLMPSSRTNFKKYIRLLGTLFAPVAPLDVHTQWAAVYGTPTFSPTMQYVGLAARCVDQDTFLGSAISYFAAQV
jgi:hypothetical protein